MEDNKTHNILFVVAYKNFNEEEYFETKKILTKAGFTIRNASSYIGQAFGETGATTKIDMLFSEINAVEYDAIVFIGGYGAISFWDDWRANGLAKLFASNSKVVAGIGNGCIVIANSGILKNIDATCENVNETAMKIAGANFIDKNIVISDNIITSKTSADLAKEFANTIIKSLG